MLIQNAIDILTPDLSALDWVENFGGVVQRVNFPFEDGSGGINYKYIPVGCGLSFEDCNKNQRYKNLTPDNKNKSLLYWEILQGLTDRGEDGGRRRRRVLQGRARLVGWLNMGKLGVFGCNGAGGAVRSILPILYKEYKPNIPGGVFENSRVKFELIGERPKDADIFSLYSYDNTINGLLLYPYDFFALDVEITVYLSLCEYIFAEGPQIDCPDYTNPTP